MSPLSDRAPRDIDEVGGPSCSCCKFRNSVFKRRQYDDYNSNIASPGSKSIACEYSKCWNLGDPYEVSRMLKYEIKGGNPKTSTTSRKEVRLVHSSEEAG